MSKQMGFRSFFLSHVVSFQKEMELLVGTFLCMKTQINLINHRTGMEGDEGEASTLGAHFGANGR